MATLGPRHPDQDSNPDGECEHGQRTVFDLLGDALQGVIADFGAEAGRVIAEAQRLVARDPPAAAQSFHPVVHRRRNDVTKLLSGRG